VLDVAFLSSGKFISSLKELPVVWPVIATGFGNAYLLTLSTLILTSFLIGLCLVFKYIPYLLIDFRNASNNEIPEFAIKCWLTFLLIFPIFLDAGPLWFVLWWFILFWGYTNRTERHFAMVFVVLIMLSSWIAYVGGGLITMTHTQACKEIFLAEHGLESPQDIETLSTWVHTHAGDAEPMNALAMARIKQRDYAEAVALLNQTNNIEPTNARYYNHMGIALSGLGKYKEALTAFTNAAAIDTRSVIYLYNISKVNLTTYNIYEAEQAINRASAIDPKRTNALLSQEQQNKNVRFIMEAVPTARLLARQMRPSDTQRAAADELWRIPFGLLDRNKAIWLGLVVLGLIYLLGHFPNEKYTKICERCGNSFYVGTTSKQGHPMCLQCNWLEIKSKKHVGAILSNKLEDIKQYRITNRLRTSKMEIILPGLGSLVANRTARGIGWLFIISTAIIMVITGGGFMSSFLPVGMHLRVYIRIVGVVLIALVYWRAYKSPPIRLGA
jgi:tetratricopeptide (TPR) repeat protein